MTTQWDRSVDLLIAGSGGGGMVAALAALDSGIEPLVIEKQALVGVPRDFPVAWCGCRTIR